jgi:quinoprotein glucose dehydrogenase
MRKWVIPAVLVYLAATPAAQEPSRAGADWFSYGGDPGGTRYSSLREITKANVGQLKEAWQFEAPDPGRLQTTPLVVNGTMYVVSPRQKVIALDAATGRQKWIFDSGAGTTAAVRGLTWWTDGKENRLFSAAANFIYAINPADGTAITGFGKDGRIDLRENLPGAAANNGYHATSPAVVYKDLLILGGRVAERTPAPPGDQRAYDVRTGQLRWSFHTIPATGEPGSETWPPNANPRETQGGANAWAGTIVDTERGIVFIATGSPSDDFYGVDRPGDNLYGNCVIALDANTGKKLWHFQATRHDLWDSDFSAPPILLTVNSNGRRVDAVAATNKWGFIYIFNRVTGEPLFPIKEIKVPASTVPGEMTSSTQPVPTLPAPLAKQTMTRDEVTARTPEMRAWAQKEFDTFLGTNQIFTPLSIDKQTMVAPGWKGGVEWGGVTVDPDRGILYANVNNVFSLGSLTAAGNAPRRGGGSTEEGAAAAAPTPAAPGKPYMFTGYRYFMDPEGYQANVYPWGTLSAVDMNTGKYLWTVPFGEHAELADKGLTNTGAGSHGGMVLTSAGVLFAGGSEYDFKFRAFDSATGKVLWTGQLPGHGVASPATYSVNGKQYVVIAVSPTRGKAGEAASAPKPALTNGTYVVFSLP